MAALIPDEKKLGYGEQRNIFEKRTTEQANIWDQWRHLLLMEPH